MTALGVPPSSVVSSIVLEKKDLLGLRNFGLWTKFTVFLFFLATGLGLGLSQFSSFSSLISTSLSSSSSLRCSSKDSLENIALGVKFADKSQTSSLGRGFRKPPKLCLMAFFIAGPPHVSRRFFLLTLAGNMLLRGGAGWELVMILLLSSSITFSCSSFSLLSCSNF